MWKKTGTASQQELQAQCVLDMGMHSWKLGGAQVGWIKVGSTDLYEEQQMTLRLYVHQ